MHERTITIEQDGQYYNVPTVDLPGLKTMTVDEAVRRGHRNHEPAFLTEDEALRAAKERSDTAKPHGFRDVMRLKQ